MVSRTLPVLPRLNNRYTGQWVWGRLCPRAYISVCGHRLVPVLQDGRVPEPSTMQMAPTTMATLQRICLPRVKTCAVSAFVILRNGRATSRRVMVATPSTMGKCTMGHCPVDSDWICDAVHSRIDDAEEV